MVGSEGDVFTAAPSELEARMSAMGTLVLTVRGTTYVLTGMGTAFSPRPTDAQKAFLADPVHDWSTLMAEGSTVGMAADVVGGAMNRADVALSGTAIGTAMEADAYMNSERVLENVASLLKTVGVKISGRKPHGVVYALNGGLLLGLLVLIIFSLTRADTRPGAVGLGFIFVVYLGIILTIFYRSKYTD